MDPAWLPTPAWIKPMLDVLGELWRSARTMGDADRALVRRATRETYRTFQEAAQHVLDELKAVRDVADDAAFLKRVQDLGTDARWRSLFVEVNVCTPLVDAADALGKIESKALGLLRVGAGGEWRRLMRELQDGEGPLAVALMGYFRDLRADADAGGLAAVPKLRAAVKEKMREVEALMDRLVQERREMESQLRR